MSGDGPAQWYALSVHARQEKAAATDLESRGFDVLLPLRRERRLWTDRVQTVEVALFPGYLFVHTSLSAARRVDLLKVRQTYDLVGRLPGDERIALAVPDVEIESIRTVVAAERELDPVQQLVRGSPVRVVAGPLKGVVGVVEAGVDGKRRLVVQVELLGRGVRALLLADDVIAAIETPTAAGRDRA